MTYFNQFSARFILSLLYHSKYIKGGQEEMNSAIRQKLFEKIKEVLPNLLSINKINVVTHDGIKYNQDTENTFTILLQTSSPTPLEQIDKLTSELMMILIETFKQLVSEEDFLRYSQSFMITYNTNETNDNIRIIIVIP
jgi:hypothetical protein